MWNGSELVLAKATLRLLPERTGVVVNPDAGAPMAGADSRWRSALAQLADGGAVLLIDTGFKDDDLVEANLVMAASGISDRSMAFIIRHTSGLVGVALPAERCDRLDLPLMVADAATPEDRKFTVSVDAAVGVSTGISAADRARTMRLLAATTTMAGDFSRPGHVFPLRVDNPQDCGAVGAALAMVTQSGAGAAAALAVVVNDDGAPTTLASVRHLSVKLGVPMVTMDEVVFDHRGCAVSRTSTTTIAIEGRWFNLTGYRAESRCDRVDVTNLAVLTRLDIASGSGLVGLTHIECVASQVFGPEVVNSAQCDCSRQWDQALSSILKSEADVLIRIGSSGVGCPASRVDNGPGLDVGSIQAAVLADLNAESAR